MLTQQGGRARGIDTGDIGDVIAVLFQPIDCGVFGAKKKVLWAAKGCRNHREWRSAGYS